MRDKNIDMYRGLLIVLVVLGHYMKDIVHDIIFLFHMPLFFVISGCFMNKSKMCHDYLKKKSISLLIPYITYMLLEFISARRYSLKAVARILWGGRALGGTYWYITCFLFALVFFSLYQKYFSDTVTKYLILAGGGIAVFESHLAEKISFLKSPGVPWNLDVALLALVYLAIGYYNKERIKCILESDKRKYDIAAAMIAVILIVFCYFNYRDDKLFYYFDMKPVYYHELFSAVIIPCSFGFVIARLIHRIENCRVLDRFSHGMGYLGQMTIPIMFMHIPLNAWKDVIGYGRIVYVLIGIGIPVLFIIIFNRFHIMRRLFGLPEVKGYSKAL